MKNLLLITLLSLTIISTNTQAVDEGIKVHGHWKFEIYNPDGSFDRKVEFENSLTSNGISFLEQLFLKNILIDTWFIRLNSVATGTLCDIDSNNTQCDIVEPGRSRQSPLAFYDNLSISSNSSGITLSGFIKAPLDGVINGVNTFVQTCTRANFTTCSQFSTAMSFTSKTLTNSVSLNSGQIIHVTVEISFS